MHSLYALSPVLFLAVSVIVLSDGVATSACFCPQGCFKRDFQELCCQEICEEAEMKNSVGDCKKLCPHYQQYKHFEQKLETSEEKCQGEINYWKNLYEEATEKLETMSANYNHSKTAETILREKLLDIQSSRKWLSGLATPLCLIGAFILVIIVAMCVYYNSQACNRARMREDPDGPGNDREFGRPKLSVGSHLDPNTETSFCKASGFQSVCPVRVEQPPEYCSGAKVGRVASRHSQLPATLPTTGIMSPCTNCTQSPPLSNEFERDTNNRHLSLVLQQQQQQQQQLLILQQSQLQPQMLQQQQQQFASQGVNQTVPNNLKVVNQLATKQNVQPHETADSGSESEQRQTRKNENAAGQMRLESAFRLADLDFAPDQQPAALKCQQAERRPDR